MEVIKDIRTRRGANLNIKGKAEKILDKTISASNFALMPDDFFGTIPKLLLKEGDSVEAGSPIFFSKKNPAIKFVSPVAGILKSIERGPKRKIERILIEAFKTQKFVTHSVKSWDKMSREEIKSLLMESGNWPFIHQRPYGIMANPLDTPKAIFVSTIKTNPLYVDMQFILKNDKKEFQLGIDLLNMLVDQPVFLGVEKSFSGYFGSIERVKHYTVEGPHPSGNLSLHIQRISPLNIGERIWSVNAEDVANLGRFINSGIYSPQRTVAVSGNAVQQPRYFETIIGSELGPILKKAGIKHEDFRVINGDVLSGSGAAFSDFLSYFNNLITVIPEGNKYRMFGWLPFKDNSILSLSNTSFSRFFNRKGFEVDTNLNGEERALVVTGEMEKIFPLEIFPMQLLKACMVEDIEKMEALGIYEVVPEDFGLVDYANTSKLEAQEIIRQGIELMIKEVG
ncbi:MAG: NADH:ubiquinone reductase (Na(+)-transporting) subunit A [Flavobacteriaceae bacterium]|nr:NADH:ubiquinone reductase (Na(+)-transporting) subunit A [Flavobacteriaceae bacterium]